MSDINLFAKQDTTLFKKQSTIRIFRIFSLVLLFTVAFFSVIIFVLKLNSPLAALQKEEAASVSQISQYSDTIVESHVIKDKLSAFLSISSNRPDFNKAIELLTSDLFSNVTVNTVSISKDGFSLTGSSPSLTSMNNLLDALTSLSNKKTIQSVTLNSLDAVDKGYSISLVVKY